MTKYKATVYCGGAKTEINNLFDSVVEARAAVREWLPDWFENGAKLTIEAVKVEDNQNDTV